jgi:hypothetical protein
MKRLDMKRPDMNALASIPPMQRSGSRQSFANTDNTVDVNRVVFSYPETTCLVNRAPHLAGRESRT